MTVDENDDEEELPMLKSKAVSKSWEGLPTKRRGIQVNETQNQINHLSPVELPVRFDDFIPFIQIDPYSFHVKPSFMHPNTFLPIFEPPLPPLLTLYPYFSI
ncbi:unnamed protein product [Rhizophagus irregularis]|nr:unnamed protein product [Rhizophagus irregularis]CAB5355579.1 unnamed protein product [Rhizophagus irregularis]